MVERDRTEGEGDREVKPSKVTLTTIAEDRTPKRKRVNGAAKGAQWERDLAEYFVSLGYVDARRMIRTGTVKHDDEGDIDGVPFTVQAKDWTRWAPKGITEAQVAQVLTDARKQARAKGHLIGFAVEKVARKPVELAWAHLDVLTLAYVSCYDLPRDLAHARLLQGTHTRMRLGYLMKLLAVKYPPAK